MSLLPLFLATSIRLIWMGYIGHRRGWQVMTTEISKFFSAPIQYFIYSDDSDDPDLRRDAQSRSPKTSAWHSFRNFAGMGVAHLELAFLSAASEVLAFIARHSSISARRNSGSSCDKWPCSATSRQSVSVIAWFWYWVS